MIPEGVNQAAWQDFDEWRTTHKDRKVRSGWTDLAKKKIANKLKQLSYEDQQKCVDASIERGWTSVFPESLGRSHEARRTNSERYAEYTDRLFGRRAGQGDDGDLRGSMDGRPENRRADHCAIQSLGVSPQPAPAGQGQSGYQLDPFDISGCTHAGTGAQSGAPSPISRYLPQVAAPKGRS